MSGFVNPLGLRRADGFAQRTADIKRWTRDILSLGDDVVVSVSELACSEPGCPPRHTVILIMPPEMTTWHCEVQKPIMDIARSDVATVLAVNAAGR